MSQHAAPTAEIIRVPDEMIRLLFRRHKERAKASAAANRDSVLARLKEMSFTGPSYKGQSPNSPTTARSPDTGQSTHAHSSLHKLNARPFSPSSSAAPVWRFDAEEPTWESLPDALTCVGITPAPPYELCGPVHHSLVENWSDGETMAFPPFPDDESFDFVAFLDGIDNPKASPDPEALPDPRAPPIPNAPPVPDALARADAPDEPDIPEHLTELKWECMDRNVQDDEAYIATADELMSRYGMSNEDIVDRFISLYDETEFKVNDKTELELILSVSPTYLSNRRLPLAPRSPVQAVEARGNYLQYVKCDNPGCRLPNCSMHVQAKRLLFSPPTRRALSPTTPPSLPPPTHKPCGPLCYLHEDQLKDEILEDWDDVRLLYLKEAIAMYPAGRSCDLSAFCSSSCRQAHLQRLKLYPELAAEADSSAESTDDTEKRRAEDRERQARKRRITKDQAERAELQDSFVEAKWRPFFVPCDHDGQCEGAGCACATNDIACEWNCLCDSSCVRRNRGCRCALKLGSCRNASCPCVLQERECDVKLCHGGKLQVQMPAKRSSKPIRDKCCGNVDIQRGERPRASVKSSAHGWGLFIEEKVKKHQFIGEYTGEILTQVREEREAGVDQHEGRAYGFELNPDWSINARSMGNETRFINHSVAANIIPKLKIVSGDNRIAFYANRDIARGEELTFNYGPKFKTALGQPAAP